MNRPKLLSIASIFLFSGITGVTNAAVIDFEDVASGSCRFYDNQITSQGFTLTDDGSPLTSEGLWMCDAGVIANNTTQALASANGPSFFRLEEANGDLFSLESFYAGARHESHGIDLIGYTDAGDVLSTSVNFSGYDWDQFSLDSWVNLTSVEFSVIGPGNFLLDDIAVTAGRVAVTEPSSLVLLSLSLVGLGLQRRRRTHQS